MKPTLSEFLINADPINILIRDLKMMSISGVVTRLFNKKMLKPEVIEFGIALLKLKKPYYVNSFTHYGSKESIYFSKWMSQEMWEKPEYYKLLVFFFGETNAKLVKAAWDKLPFLMYQSDLERRSFRAPKNKRVMIVSQINFLRNILDSPYVFQDGEKKIYDLDLKNQVRFDIQLNNNPSQYLIWASAIDLDISEISVLFEDIIYGREEIGKVSRNIIKALLNSQKKENWQLVEKLLIAAQRQEGLRQTIFESIDESSVEAMQFMLQVIVDNKLTRFSSVVRAFDTWTGLGWQSEKESTVIRAINLAIEYLQDKIALKLGLKSQDNLELYMALWALSVSDFEMAQPYLIDLLENGSNEKKCLAAYFGIQSQIPDFEVQFYYKCLDFDDLELLSIIIPRMTALIQANEKSNVFVDNKNLPGFFDKFISRANNIKIKEKTIESSVFSWLNTKFERDKLLHCGILLIGNKKDRLELILQHFETMPIGLREILSHKILEDFHVNYLSSISNKKIIKVPTDFQKEFALRMLKTRGDSMMASGINTLKRVNLTSNELNSLKDLFNRKDSNLKMNLSALVLSQKGSVIETFINGLINDNDENQRMLAMDLLQQLKKLGKMETFVAKTIAGYVNSEKTGEKEKKLIENINKTRAGLDFKYSNGFGFFDPKKIERHSLPAVSQDSVFIKNSKFGDYGFSMPYTEIKSALKKLEETFKKHMEYEYEVIDWNGSKETVVLANQFQNSKGYRRNNDSDLKFEDYPLHEVWDNWFKSSRLQPTDLFILTLTSSCESKKLISYIKSRVFFFGKEIPNPTKSPYYWSNPVYQILCSLMIKYPVENFGQFLIDATILIFKNIPHAILNSSLSDESDFASRNGWQFKSCMNIYLDELKNAKLDDNQIFELWKIYRWRQFSGVNSNFEQTKPPFHLYLRLFSMNKISIDDFLEGLLDEDNLKEMTTHLKLFNNGSIKNHFSANPNLMKPVTTVINTILDSELERGESKTDLTKFAVRLQYISGLDRFVNILKGIGKYKLSRGYNYYWGSDDTSLQKVFSHLLKNCYPQASDTQEQFNSLISKEKFSDLRLVEAGVYAPQWQKFISNYLDWNGLNSAIWWMHAHTKTPTYTSPNSELESEVARFSDIEIQDFMEGAVDNVWFQSAFSELGKKRWDVLYEAAKYISEGNGHTRARLYSDVLSGAIGYTQVLEKVESKRNQDYLRILGLAPFNTDDHEAEVLERYEFILKFKKESKNHGSMRQASEAVAIRVALENLARMAGYPDPVRLTWAMESKQVNDIFAKETQVTIDGITVGLIVEENGKAELVCFRGDKQIKSIPASIKKDPSILELSGYRKIMREQWSRSKKSLEDAMIRGDEFSVSEIINLSNHPVISKHLQKLVLISNDNKLGFFNNGLLNTPNGEKIILEENHVLRIAHSFDLHANKVWVDFQQYCFNEKLIQPFKQVFRELYTPTPDELFDGKISKRYAGHQIQPKIAAALFKTRGWKLDYEEGLQKVFHKDGYYVELYAMADWFSPSDNESPTVETIQFSSLKNHEIISLNEINPRIFSEVMRDVDLVVSVAHAGGVDPEASHSTIEMRKVLLVETAKLFKFSNVEIKDNHAVIRGKLATYSLHLGSGVVHQMPGKYLSILPVHSQHRGRLFLPFADDDPKSAEILSKAILLSKDDKIQDPTVLQQIDMQVDKG